MDRRHPSTIIPEIYQATIDPDHWNHVLEKITEVTRSKIACLYYLDKAEGITSTIAQFGSPTNLIQNYSKQFEKLDSLFDRVLAGIRKVNTCVNSLVQGEMVIPNSSPISMRTG